MRSIIQTFGLFPWPPLIFLAYEGYFGIFPLLSHHTIRWYVEVKVLKLKFKVWRVGMLIKKLEGLTWYIKTFFLLLNGRRVINFEGVVIEVISWDDFFLIYFNLFHCLITQFERHFFIIVNFIYTLKTELILLSVYMNLLAYHNKPHYIACTINPKIWRVFSSQPW